MNGEMHVVLVLAVALGSLILLAVLAVAVDTLRLSPEDVARAHAIVAARTREQRR
jgi:hypothetical protein